MKKRIKGFPLVLVGTGVILLLDQITKIRAHDVWATAPWEPVSWFGFTYSENHGIAFGLPFGGVPLLIVTTLLILGFVWYAVTQLDVRQRLDQIAMALVVGGAVGNLIDRFVYGVVRDFIQIGVWPTFNIADMAIVSGLLMLMIAYRKGDKV
jgi:signal peptidase II